MHLCPGPARSPGVCNKTSGSDQRWLQQSQSQEVGFSVPLDNAPSFAKRDTSGLLPTFFSGVSRLLGWEQVLMLAPVRPIPCSSNETSCTLGDCLPSEHRDSTAWGCDACSPFSPQDKEVILQSKQGESPLPAPLPLELTAGWAGLR